MPPSHCYFSLKNGGFLKKINLKNSNCSVVNLNEIWLIGMKL